MMHYIRWLCRLPWFDLVQPVGDLLAVVALLGIVVILAGLYTAQMGIILGGILLAAPFLLFMLLLWRTSRDDGYY